MCTNKISKIALHFSVQIDKHISLTEPLRHHFAQLPFFLFFEHFIKFAVAPLKAPSQHDAEHIFDSRVLVTISGHIFPLTNRISDFEVGFHEFGVVLFVLLLFVENRSAIELQQVYSCDFLVELIHVKPQYFLQDHRSVLLLF